jgi:methylmalonyl-CoA mutase C-terminal domain/subunit
MISSESISSESVCRVLVAKIGFDGHDRGIKVVARTLRDAGMEVIYAGLRQTPETVAAIARDEDVDVVGISMHNGAHLTIAPRVITALRDAGARAAVIVGGIVPDPDIALLHEAGVAAVLGPGASGDEVVEAVIQACRTAAPDPLSG